MGCRSILKEDIQSYPFGRGFFLAKKSPRNPQENGPHKYLQPENQEDQQATDGAKLDQNIGETRVWRLGSGPNIYNIYNPEMPKTNANFPQPFPIKGHTKGVFGKVGSRSSTTRCWIHPFIASEAIGPKKAINCLVASFGTKQREVGRNKPN